MRLYPEQTPDEEFQTLRGEGYTGSLNDMIYQYLRSQGFTGSINDMLIRNFDSGSDPLARYTFNGVAPALVADFSRGFYYGTITGTSDLITTGSYIETVDGATGLRVTSGVGSLRVPAALIPAYTDAFCMVVRGRSTHAKDGSTNTATLYTWQSGSTYMRCYLRTDSERTGTWFPQQNDGTNYDWQVGPDAARPGTNTPFNMAVRHTSSAVQTASDGVAGSVNDTPVALADLSAINLSFCTKGDFLIEEIAIYTTDLDTAGIQAATAVEFDVFGLFGQSNMMGVATYDGLGYHDGGAYQWTFSGQVLQEAEPPLLHQGPVGGSMGLDVTFANDYLMATGRQLVFVPAAWSNTGFSDNQWNQGDPRYTSAVASINALLASEYQTNLKGILWVQGETDAVSSVSQSAYATYLDDMIAAMRSDITGGSTVPFVAGQIGEFLSAGSYPTASDINAAIADLPNRVSNTAFASSSSLTDLGDGTHYDASSLRTLGSRMYTAWASI